MNREQHPDARLVEAWLKEPTWLAPTDDARVATLVHQTPQVRHWPPQVDLGRFSPMLNATKFVVASLVLALFGGFLLAGLPTEPNSEPMPAAATATTTPTEPVLDQQTDTEATEPLITLPSDLPEGVDSGTITTPAGPVRWVRITATEESIPRWVDRLVPWGDGVATWPGIDSRLHATDDGVKWEPVGSQPLPGPPAYLDGNYVVVDPRSDQVWTSIGPEGVWTELDAEAMTAARPQGWQGLHRYVATGPMIVDGRIIFTVRTSYKLPHQRLGIPLSKNKAMKSLSGGRYALCGSGVGNLSCRKTGADAEWVLRLEEAAKGLTVVNDRSGARLGLLKGASADDIYEGERGVRHSIFAIDGDTLVEIDSPWPGLRPEEVSDRTVAPGSSIPLARWWRSEAGADPVAPGLPAIASEIPEGWSLSLTNFPDRLEAYAVGPGAWAVGTAWVSSDGIEWAAAPDGVPARAEPRWTGSGWIATKQSNESTEHWMHLGGDWVSLSALELPNEPRGFGNVTVFGGDDELWVLTHPLGNKTE